VLAKGSDGFQHISHFIYGINFDMFVVDPFYSYYLIFLEAVSGN
jgi:hypothetical protein